MFKLNDQLRGILIQHNIFSPHFPIVSHGTPTQYQTEHVQVCVCVCVCASLVPRAWKRVWNTLFAHALNPWNSKEIEY